MALTKCINSESKQYKPVLVDKLILDDVPTVNSLNAITSDAVARAVAGASGEVPAVTENDNGKVLKAVYDAGGPAVEWGEAAPAVTVDQTYNALSENPQSGVAVAEAIAAIPAPSVDEVPDVTSSDDGKVLTASYSGGAGSYSWQTAQGGGSDVTTASGNFKLGGSVPVTVNYTGSQEYERGSLQLVNTFSEGTYAVAVFEIVGEHNIYYETHGTATVTINEAMDIAGTGISDFAITFLNSDSRWNMDGQIYKNPSPTVTDGKIVAQSLSFYSISQYATGPYLGVGVKVTNNPNESEKIAAVVQQLANGSVSISDWPKEQITVTTIPNIPAYTSADAGKVLQVQNDGTLAWVTLS